MNMEQNRSLDFTNSDNVGNNGGVEKIIVPGVGTMTVEEAKSLISPGKIPGSNIEFTPEYTAENLRALRDAMEEHKGLFSDRDVKTYAGFIAEIEKRVLTKQALEDLEKNTSENLH